MAIGANNKKNEMDNWRPRTPQSGAGADVEEGMSIDDSQQASTNLSIENNESQSDLPLGSIELVGIIHGNNYRRPSSSPSFSSRTSGRSLSGNEVDEMMMQQPQYDVEQIDQKDDITQRKIITGRNRNIMATTSTTATTPPPMKAFLQHNISPDSSKDSEDSLIHEKSESNNSSSRKKKSIRFSPTNEIRHFTPNPDEFDQNPLSDKPYLSCGGTARLFLVVYALPFMHGASSNITTIYLLVELTLRYEINSWIVGGYLALAYVCRLFLSFMSRVVPKTCVLMASIITYLGFGLIYISQNKALLQNLGWYNNEFLLFLVGSILANTNEMTSAMQVFVRDQLTHNVKELGQKLKRHYFIAKFARVASFSGGGVLYHYYGVGGLAILGGFMVLLQIICLAIFFLLDTYREVIDQNDGLWGEMKPPKRFTLDCSIRAAVGRRRMFKSSMSNLNRTLGKYYPSTMPSKVVNSILPICVYGRTLASIIVWNVIAYIMHTDFNQDYIVIGGVFAGIMVCDLLMTLVTLSDAWNIRLKTKLPPPREVFLLTTGMTLSLALVAVPNFTVFIIGLIIYICFNNAMRTLLLELQGTNDSVWDSFKFHLIRCLSTAGALFSLPVLNSFHKRLPLVLAIWFALLTSAVLVYIINIRTKEEDDTNELDRKNRNSIMTASSTRISRRPEKNLVYGEQIMLSRLIKGKTV